MVKRSVFYRIVLFSFILGICCSPSIAVAQASKTSDDVKTTLHDGLMKARQNEAFDPAAVTAFTRLQKEYGTPLYIYDREIIDEQANAIKEAFGSLFPKLHLFYAVKANTSLAVISQLRGHGLGTEVISGGEIITVRKLGVPGNDIMFTSSSKSPWEIELALKEGILLNVDSVDELNHIEVMAGRLHKIARISFRINPGVDPHTIHQINTGITESKFGIHLADGIAFSAYKWALKLSHVKIVGLHCHIGSQITEPEGYRLAAGKMLAFAADLKEKLGIQLEFIDLGGGIGIPYQDDQTVMTPGELAQVLRPIWQDGVKRMGYEPTLWLEPGRFFVAPAGFLLTRVNSVKTTPVKTFVNVDAGFNTLIRPAMYQAYHRVRIVGRKDRVMKLDIAGDVCETGDILAADRILPRPVAGDLVVILDAGAYGFSMASEYNARPLPAEVMVSRNQATLIRKRGQMEDIFRNQVTEIDKSRRDHIRSH
ncbi:MAG: diaminopimelate decarboxylase [Candidatus Riflebacteria bacterium]|nr:diaminopimelate decarboxylase [Candidatus Riflebacteria bacterium]